MKFKWPLAAKIVVPVCLFSIVVSGQAARTQEARATEAITALQQAQHRLSALHSKESELRTRTDWVSTDAFAGAPIDRALAAVLTHVMTEREIYAIAIDQIALGEGAAGGGTAVPIRDFASVVPNVGTQMRIVKLVLKGSYVDYQQFCRFLSSYSDVPAALTALNVNARSFELTIEVLGT